MHADPNGPTVKLPNNQQITASHSGFLPFSKHLSKSATKTSLFNNLSNNLISIGQLYDDGCEVLFTQSHMQVTKNKNIIITGTRSTCGDGLWDITLPSSSSNVTKIHSHQSLIPSPHLKSSSRTFTPSLNVIIKKSTTAKDLAIYLHASCFSPSKSTFIKAIHNNHFIGWPGLSKSLIHNHLPISIPTVKGHLKQERQGLQSTSKSTNHQDTFHNNDMYPPSNSFNKKTMTPYIQLHPNMTRHTWISLGDSLIALVEAMSTFWWYIIMIAMLS